MSAVIAYHNTTSLAGSELLAAAQAAQRQDDAVLAVFHATGRAMTPSDVWRITTDAGHRWPLTSIRRAITNLTTAGALERLDHTRVGPYGRPECVWAPVARGQRDMFARRRA